MAEKDKRAADRAASKEDLGGREHWNQPAPNETACGETTPEGPAPGCDPLDGAGLEKDSGKNSARGTR